MWLNSWWVETRRCLMIGTRSYYANPFVLIYLIAKCFWLSCRWVELTCCWGGRCRATMSLGATGDLWRDEVELTLISATSSKYFFSCSKKRGKSARRMMRVPSSRFRMRYSVMTERDELIAKAIGKASLRTQEENNRFWVEFMKIVIHNKSRGPNLQ